MPSIQEAVPLWFIAATIGMLLVATALGIGAVIWAKNKKLSQNKDA